MTPPEAGLDTMSALIWICFVIRDPAAILALGTTGIGLLAVIIGLLVRKRARLDWNLAVGGLMAWLVAATGCLAPLDKGVIMTRSWVIVALLLSGLLWVLMIVVYRWGKRAICM